MFAFTIDQVADIVGLERQRNSSRECSFNVRCPICRDKHYKLNIDRTKGVWRCAKCDAHGGTLDLYVRFGMGLGADECNKATRYRAKKEIMDMLKLSLNEPVRKLPIVYEDDHTVLSDTELHTVYSALLKIPALRLRYEHYKQLIERGLTDDYIMCNEYRSIPDRLYLPKGKKETMTEFRSGQIYMLCRENSRFKRMGQKNIISGIYIGMYLTEQGINLDGVPGFFKLLGLWCFNYIPGLLIPVRNIHGEIVGLQIRTEFKTKYITVSSKGIERGTSAMCRVHFPLNNPKLEPDTIIRLTEGPLKADVASALSNERNIAYIALLGVNSTNDLVSALEQISNAGCRIVQNALDMDKLTNPNVAKAELKINGIVRNAGLSHPRLYWDIQTARSLCEAQEDCLADHGIDIDQCSESSIFLRVLHNTLKLSENKIAFPHEWPNPNMKGIDDYLRNRHA